MKEFLTIKEFSSLSGIESSTLRYWDDIGLFSPASRNPENNYRYYSPEQLITVNFITVLSNLNFPLKTISDIENERDPEKIMDLIENQEKLLDIEMRRLREAYSIIHTRRDLIKEGMRADLSKIEVVHMPKRTVVFGPYTEFKDTEAFYRPFVEFCNRAKEMRINLNYPIGGYHDDVKDFFRVPGKPDYFFSIDPMGNSALPAGDYLVGYTRGYYGDFGDLPKRMEEYAKKNSLKFAGPLYTIYLHDEICIQDPSMYLVQVCIALTTEKH